MSSKGGHHGFGGGGGGGGGGFRPRPPSRLRLGDRHRLLQQELAREAKEVQLLESRLARIRGVDHTGGDGTGGDTYTPMPPTSKAPLVDDGRDRQPRAMPPSPLPDSPAFDDSRVVPVVAPLPIRAHASAPTTRSHATAAAAAAEAPALRPGHVPLSSLPVEGVAAVLRHMGLQLYVDAFARLAVDGEMLADPTLNEEDLVELGVPIRLHRRRLLALVADFGRHGVPPEALLLRPGAAVKEEAAAPGAGGGVKEAEHPPVPMADLVQQELWAAARLELLALEEREEQEGTG